MKHLLDKKQQPNNFDCLLDSRQNSRYIYRKCSIQIEKHFESFMLLVTGLAEISKFVVLSRKTFSVQCSILGAKSKPTSMKSKTSKMTLDRRRL